MPAKPSRSTRRREIPSCSMIRSISSVDAARACSNSAMRASMCATLLSAICPKLRLRLAPDWSAQIAAAVPAFLRPSQPAFRSPSAVDLSSGNGAPGAAFGSPFACTSSPRSAARSGSSTGSATRGVMVDLIGPAMMGATRGAGAGAETAETCGPPAGCIRPMICWSNPPGVTGSCGRTGEGASCGTADAPCGTGGAPLTLLAICAMRAAPSVSPAASALRRAAISSSNVAIILPRDT